MDAFDSADFAAIAADLGVLSPGRDPAPHASAFGAPHVQASAFGGQHAQVSAFAAQRAPSCPMPLAAAGDRALSGTLSLNGWALPAALAGASSLPSPACAAEADTPAVSETTWPGLPAGELWALASSPRLHQQPSSPFAGMQRY